MRYRMLGPLRVWDGATWTEIRAAHQRLILAVLLAQPGCAVSMRRLAHEIWGEHPPRTPLSTVQTYVMRLRRLRRGGLADSLLTRAGGYELAVDPDEIDACRFERLAGCGRRSLAGGDPSSAVTQLSEGLALWRGPVLADVMASPTVEAQTTRLELLRLSAIEDYVSARLDLGRHREVVDELAGLVCEHPWRERLWAQRMLALYRCGRRVEALDAYRQGHALLTREYGIEPGPDLRTLQRAILTDDVPAP